MTRSRWLARTVCPQGALNWRYFPQIALKSIELTLVNRIFSSSPLNDRELADKQGLVVKCMDSAKQVVVQGKGGKIPSKTFYFDSVFGPERTQRDLFQSSILPIRT